MKIYVDDDYLCHVDKAEGRREFEVPLFDGKCKTFVEGYRYVPSGETWISKQGLAFPGEMVAPAVDYVSIEKAQRQYEEDLAQMEDMQNALAILGVTE